MGTGIRPVVPDAEAERSHVENAFWREQPGFTPVLLSMGASALAFTPARNVVIAEGPSDFLLLPTLIREATGRESLDFQVAPGLSVAGTDDVPALDAEGGRVAYLVDGDAGGSGLAEWLSENGVDPDRVVSLAEVAGAPVALEDLVALDVFVDAVNGELDAWCASDERLDAGDVPEAGRANALDAWCDDKGVGRVRKTSLAQRLADMRGGDRPLVAESMRPVVAGVHDALVDALEHRSRSRRRRR